MSWKATSLLSLSLSFSTVTGRRVSRAYTPAENLVLADCGIGLGDNGGSTSRQMMYYPGDVWHADGSLANNPTMMVNVPWDGSYPWRKTGVSATFSNGDKFEVAVYPEKKDPEAAGAAQHTYDSGVLVCYSYHKDNIYKLDDGTWCSSAFVCNHRTNPLGNAASNPTPTPTPTPTPDGLRTTINNNKEKVRLYGQTLDSWFNILKGAVKEGSSSCDGGSQSIAPLCSVKFDCHSAATNGAVSLGKMANFLADQFTKIDGAVEYEEKKYEFCTRYNTIPGRENQCLQYGEKTDTYLTIPSGLSVYVDTVPPEGSNREPAMQGEFKYEITCGEGDNMFCKACVAAGAIEALLPWGGVLNVFCSGRC